MPAPQLPRLFNQPRPRTSPSSPATLRCCCKAGARLDDCARTARGRHGYRPAAPGGRRNPRRTSSPAKASPRRSARIRRCFRRCMWRWSGSARRRARSTRCWKCSANERSALRGSMRRKLADAMHYPAFVLVAAGCVLLFFILFVLPQFSSVLRDFGAKVDPIILTFLHLSDLPAGQWSDVVAGGARGCDRRRLAAAAPAERAPRHRQRGGASAGDPAVIEVLSDQRCSAAISASCSAAASVSPRRCAFSSTSWRRPAVRGLDRRCRPRPPRRQTSDALSDTNGAAADGGADAAARRRNRAIADAGGPGRRILRGQAAAQPRPRRRHRRAGSPSSPSASSSAA